jgi:hypothetical protein
VDIRKEILYPQIQGVTVTTVYRRERGPQRFRRKLDSGDGGERPRGAESGALLACGEGLRLSTELLDRAAWPSKRIMMPKRGGELGFSKNQQQLNPKQEPNFTQQLAIREYF